MKNKRYLCYQQLVTKEELVGTQNNIVIDILIRNVGAKNEEEAIGKFMKVSNKTEAKKKLNVECFLLDNLLNID